MGISAPKEVTQLLVDWGNGNKAALDQLMPLVYKELRRLASQYLRRERHNHTLQSAALVNEAYLRLVDYSNLRWQDRAQFFGLAAQLMRRILIDHARSHHYAKRGGGAHRVSLDEAAILSEERASELVALDDALTSLAAMDPRKSQVVELRFFGGLNIEETAEVLKLSSMTIQREWRWAKAYLYREINNRGSDGDGTLAENC
ncbi:MAG TPA: sigma-70 family RNA polymerase sigma factor [Blastocatellia bacterium]|nr:sigma-70 family RNA polymerase sigma factor [Blastocatellia bacterium]